MKLKGKYKFWILPFFAVITFLLTRIGILTPTFTEIVYSRSIYPIIASVLSTLSNLFPFSLDDIFYGFLIFLIPVFIVLLFLKKISLKQTGIYILQILALIFILFYWFWGFNYFRQDLNSRLQISESEINSESFEKVFKEFILNANEMYVTFNNFSHEEADELVEDSYKRFSSFLKINYPMGKRRPKKITFSRFFARASILGYYGPFLNEVHLNKYLPPAQYPVVLAHEKAHQFGVTSEAEANFYAWLVCSQSNSQELQYSAGLYILRYFLSHARNLDNYRELVGLLDQRVKEDLMEIENYWMKLRDEKIDRTASRMNDAYLKSNNVEKGILDYSGVVKYILDFKTDSCAIQKLQKIKNK